MVEEVLRYLGITWNDEDLKAKVTDLIKDGTYYLESRAGEVIDFEKDRFAFSLLKDYVRYANAHALEEFEGDYLTQLHLFVILHTKEDKDEKA